MLRLLLAMCLPLAAAAQTMAFQQSVAKFARIAGLWEASLSEAQTKLLDPERRRNRLFLHIQVDLDNSQTEAVLKISDVRLDFGFPSGGIHHQFDLGDAVESERAGVIHFSAMREVPKRVALAGGRLLEAERIEATLSIGDNSAEVVFTRPVSTFQSPFAGEWVGTNRDETDVFHVYSWSVAQTLATYDRVSRYEGWASLGALFLPFGNKDEELGLYLDVLASVHQFSGVLIENGAVLDGKWHGNGFLGAERFRRSSSPSSNRTIDCLSGN